MGTGEPGDWRRDRAGAARDGRNPTVLARLETGWVVIGDHQRLPGYCVLIHDGVADHLTELPRARRGAFLADMGLVGEAVAAACAALDPAFARLNYEILGNALTQLHAHVRPRYTWEPPGLRTQPVWRHPDLLDPRYIVGPGHDRLRAEITARLLDLGAVGVSPSPR